MWVVEEEDDDNIWLKPMWKSFIGLRTLTVSESLDTLFHFLFFCLRKIKLFFFCWLIMLIISIWDAIQLSFNSNWAKVIWPLWTSYNKNNFHLKKSPRPKIRQIILWIRKYLFNVSLYHLSSSKFHEMTPHLDYDEIIFLNKH